MTAGGRFRAGAARWLGVLGAAALVSACAATMEPPASAPAPSPVATAPAPPPQLPAPAVVAPPPGPSPRQILAARHRAAARAGEGEGLLQRARSQWKVALTIDPDDPEARAGLRELDARIEREVAARMEAGRAAMARGVQLEARRQFLAALALDPANRPAFLALQNEVREVETILHTVRAGETLAGLAQRYYGDRSRAEVIWETNQLPPNPRLTAGMRLRVPEIPGVPFVHPEARRPAPVPAPAPGPAPAPEPVAAPPVGPDEYRETNPLLAEAREALDRSDWAEALADVERFLTAHPRHPEGLSVKKTALYRQGKAQLEARQYAESYRTLVQLARLGPEQADAATLLREARGRTLDQHYTRGVRLYREEKLAEAITEWREVLDIDPQHGNARRNIEQAERLLRALEDKKRKQ
jgi:tetratricopeptide (TPR) repeat protein